MRTVWALLVLMSCASPERDVTQMAAPDLDARLMLEEQRLCTGYDDYVEATGDRIKDMDTFCHD